MSIRILLMSFPAAFGEAFSQAPAAGGELTVASETPAKIATLSAQGKTDWTHWGRIHGVTIHNREGGVKYGARKNILWILGGDDNPHEDRAAIAASLD